MCTPVSMTWPPPLLLLSTPSFSAIFKVQVSQGRLGTSSNTGIQNLPYGCVVPYRLIFTLIHRGVPSCFSSPVLLELQSRPSGLNINGLPLGAPSHADNIHTLNQLRWCWAHISLVRYFAMDRSLALSMEKCKAIISWSTQCHIRVDGIPLFGYARSLAAWWTHNLKNGFLSWLISIRGNKKPFEALR